MAGAKDVRAFQQGENCRQNPCFKGNLGNGEDDNKESSPVWHWEMGRDVTEKIRYQDQFLLKCDFVDYSTPGYDSLEPMIIPGATNVCSSFVYK